MQKQEVENENIVSCPHTCNCDDCPFLKDDVPVIKVILSESEESLNHEESVLSIPHSTTPQETNKRNSFLKITSCMPIRDCKLIIHWNVESYKGILGYRVSDLSLIQCFSSQSMTFLDFHRWQSQKYCSFSSQNLYINI